MDNKNTAKAPSGILRHKWYLYLTEFFSGVSVMAVELGASRLLAPYFSSSQIVWTIIIGTIMIAMALGNIYGGRSADKNPDPDTIPCFRVVNAKGELAGEFAFGGSGAQAKLLEAEGITVAGGKVDLTMFQWKY